MNIARRIALFGLVVGVLLLTNCDRAPSFDILGIVLSRVAFLCGDRGTFSP